MQFRFGSANVHHELEASSQIILHMNVTKKDILNFFLPHKITTYCIT